MAYLYRIDEYVEYSNFISFRKQFFHKKGKEFLEKSEENLKNYAERIANYDPGFPESPIEVYIKKAEDLILLKNFEEATKCLDTVIKYNYTQFNVRAYFLKGFISCILKDYKNALTNYVVALYQITQWAEQYWIEDILKEIRITNKQLYGYEDGLKKTIEQLNLFLEKHPEISVSYIVKCEIAKINYLINNKQALKEFDAILEETKLTNKEGNNVIYKGGEKPVSLFIGKIKCCLYNLKNKKLTKEKKEQLVKEIEKAFELLDKVFIEKTDYNYSGKKYFPFAKFNIIVYRLKHIYYKLLNKETDFYNKSMQLFKEKRFKRFCFSLPKEKLDKFVKKYSCSGEIYKKCLENLLFNDNIDVEYFKETDDIWNITFTKQEVENFAMALFDITTNYIEKYKYLLDKYIQNLKEYTFDFGDYKPIEFFLSFGFPLDFIKYLVEEKEVDYKKENIDEMLKSALYMGGKGYNEYLKYFFDDLKVPITYNFILEVCRCSLSSKADFEMLKIFIEEKNFNPKMKNDKEENLLFSLFKDYRFPFLNGIEENIFNLIDYLITKCGLDINEKNIYNETILYILLSAGSKETKENKYKIADYLLKNYKVKLDRNTKMLLQKDFISFLKYIYKNIKE